MDKPLMQTRRLRDVYSKLTTTAAHPLPNSLI
jgi:hypothetical protein